MGHVPSRDLITRHFVVDVETARGNVDTIVAVGMCSQNLPKVDDDLFQKFMDVRCDAPILYWYCFPRHLERGELPPVPPAVDVYFKTVVEAQQVIDRNLSPSQYTPMPIMLVRIADQYVAAAKEGQVNFTDAAVIGYVGCRGFSSGGALHDESAVGVFLGKQFYNEAKSVAMLSIACRCYDHFYKKASADGSQTPWPQTILIGTNVKNVPSLRLMQKVFQTYVHDLIPSPGSTGSSGVEGREDYAVAIHGDQFQVTVRSKLANQVFQRFLKELNFRGEAPNGTPLYSLRTSDLRKRNGSAKFPPLDQAIEAAKATWRESNDPVTRGGARYAGFRLQLPETTDNAGSVSLGSSQSDSLTQFPAPHPGSWSHSASTPRSSPITQFHGSSLSSYPTYGTAPGPTSPAITTTAPMPGFPARRLPESPVLPNQQMMWSVQMAPYNTVPFSTSEPHVQIAFTRPAGNIAHVSGIADSLVLIPLNTPVFICGPQRHWLAVYWNQAQTPVRQSQYPVQQQGPREFVCFETTAPCRTYADDGKEYYTSAELPYVFVERGRVLFRNGAQPIPFTL